MSAGSIFLWAVAWLRTIAVRRNCGGGVINPRSMVVLICDRAANQFKDRTPDVSEIRTAGQRVEIVFIDSNKPFGYGRDRVRILRDPKRHTLTDGERVEVDGNTWESATEVLTFSGTNGEWSRIFYRTHAGEAYRTYPASHVRVITSATETPAVADVLHYWLTVVSRLPPDDPLRPVYEKLAFVRPESALNSFLSGSPIESRPQDITPIFRFRCNLSQRAAVEKALTCSVSVIEGPPGTGKTETILNLIANIVAVQHMTFGIVSFGNAAVDNVRDKLDELGFGHVIGDLGRKEKREEFFARQAVRNTQVAQFLVRAPDRPDLEHLADLDRRLRGLQSAERIRADRRQALDAYRLELRHFEDHLHQDKLPDLAGLPLLHRSADRVLDHLAESEMELAGIRPGPLRRIRNYFRYGAVRTLDPADTSVVLRLQLAYYHKRIAELEREIGHVEDELRRADFEELSRQHQQLSVQFLHSELAAPSEDIIWTVLHDIIAEQRYAHLTVSSQVLLRNLIPDLSGLTLAQRAALAGHRSRRLRLPREQPGPERARCAQGRDPGCSPDTTAAAADHRQPGTPANSAGTGQRRSPLGSPLSPVTS